MRSISCRAALLLTLASCSALGSKPTPHSLFDGRSLAGWHADVPEKDKDPKLPDSFVARDGMLVSLGKPAGHLITDASLANYRLVVEYR